MHTHATETCLFCGSSLTEVFADLGTSPPSNAFLTKEQCALPEQYYPLRAYVCTTCMLVQGPHYKRPQDIFNHDYAYYSSYSRSWVEHARQYVVMMAERFGLGPKSRIIEVGSNDGYLLQHAVQLGIPVLGVDPSSGAASVAQTKGIPTITDFFTSTLAANLARAGRHADLICGINVFAHIPNINDFVSGLAILLKPDGVVTMEFPYLKRLVEDVQFDTIYHEHYFYYTVTSVSQILRTHGLRIFDVEELPTHGGSLRIFACRAGGSHESTGNEMRYLALERDTGMHTLPYYADFQKKIDMTAFALMQFLIEAARQGKSVGAYGAAAKGNTLLNYAGVKSNLVSYVADASPVKQGKYLPGSRIPVVTEDRIRAEKPDYVLVLPWNLKDEISQQLAYIREWGGQFVTAIPSLSVW